MENRCAVCGEIIPEGRQVCPNCMEGFVPSMKGYVILPCFTVEVDENGGCEMTCNNVLGWIFETFFAQFWSGRITIYDEK